MVGCFVNFRDGVSGRIASFLLTETYAGVLAGTLTVATRHILPRLLMKMSDLGEGKAKGYFCLPPDLVEEKDVMNYSEEQFRYLSENTSGITIPSQEALSSTTPAYSCSSSRSFCSF